ncbi:MAG: inositol monophosphatase family protein [Candidatus Gottesmanbacteria bacterium]|nr:inositol monophosphatase family protein [Candidatus Gottesmanbacteria bacterium]
MSATYYQQLQKDAEFIVQRAAILLRRYQQKATIVVQKDIGDFATTADLASESLIRAYIHKRYPTHSIYGEEGGLEDNQSEYEWIIDPLDGTKEYARGVKEYNCLIAVEHDKKLVVGVIRRAGLDELYSAVVRQGAKKDGKTIGVSKIRDLPISHVGYHLPVGMPRFERARTEKHFSLLKELTFMCYRLRPSWDDAKSLGYVASGVIEAHIIPAELPNAWHDLAAGLLLVQEAGGRVTHLDGSELKTHDMSRGFLASNGLVHDKLIQLIGKD